VGVPGRLSTVAFSPIANARIILIRARDRLIKGTSDRAVLTSRAVQAAHEWIRFRATERLPGDLRLKAIGSTHRSEVAEQPAELDAMPLHT
jgi:hypothetical protein